MVEIIKNLDYGIANDCGKARYGVEFSIDSEIGSVHEKTVWTGFYDPGPVVSGII